MLWYKVWLDTRWKAVIGAALLLFSATGTVFSYASVQELIGSLPAAAAGDAGAYSEALREAVEVQRTFRGYAWSNWFSGNFVNLLTILAVVLGSGSPLSRSGRGLLFSLALPVSRKRWITTRAATLLAELFVLAFVPSLLLVALAPLAQQHFAVGEALVYSASAFLGTSVFVSLALFLSTVFEDVWRPLLLALCAAFAIGAVGIYVLPEGRGLFAAMSGRSYFFEGSLPWLELSACVAATAALIYAAAASIARRDF
jgi:ABC-type transport system involved in multi-copper enzyme maturation permease subunit